MSSEFSILGPEAMLRSLILILVTFFAYYQRMGPRADRLITPMIRAPPAITIGKSTLATCFFLQQPIRSPNTRTWISILALAIAFSLHTKVLAARPKSIVGDQFGLNQSNPASSGVSMTPESPASPSRFFPRFSQQPNNAVRRGITPASDTFLMPVEFSRNSARRCELRNRLSTCPQRAERLD